MHLARCIFLVAAAVPCITALVPTPSGAHGDTLAQLDRRAPAHSFRDRRTLQGRAPTKQAPQAKQANSPSGSAPSGGGTTTTTTTTSKADDLEAQLAKIPGLQKAHPAHESGGGGGSGDGGASCLMKREGSGKGAIQPGTGRRGTSAEMLMTGDLWLAVGLAAVPERGIRTAGGGGGGGDDSSSESDSGDEDKEGGAADNKVLYAVTHQDWERQVQAFARDVVVAATAGRWEGVRVYARLPGYAGWDGTRTRPQLAIFAMAVMKKVAAMLDALPGQVPGIKTGPTLWWQPPEAEGARKDLPGRHERMFVLPNADVFVDCWQMSGLPAEDGGRVKAPSFAAAQGGA